jgi:hypothetical protein
LLGYLGCYDSVTFIGATLLSAASYATPQATVDISLLKSEAMSIVKKFGATLKPQLKSALIGVISKIQFLPNW